MGLIKKKIIIKNYTNASDYTIFKLLDMYSEVKNDRTIMFNNMLYMIEKKTTMYKTIIKIK